MFLLLVVLTNNSVDHSLQDIFLWDHAFHIFDQVVCIVSLIVLKVVNNQIQSSFGYDIDKWRENLKGILSASEDDEVMSQQVIVLKNVSNS